MDGGYYLKNPSISVLAEVWKHKSYYASESLKEEDIVLLSISTGSYSNNKKDWSVNINEVLSDQSKATHYIKEQNLLIDLPKINYLRVDLNYGGGSFSFMKLMEIGEKIEALSNNKEFHMEVNKLLAH